MNKKYLAIGLIFIHSYIFGINIDGKLSETEWLNAKSFDNFVTVFPNDKSKPKYKTEVKYFSDKKGIYFGVISEQPYETQTSKKHVRDDFMVSADRIFIIIDFDGNANTGYEFGVSIGDSLRDAIYTNENEFSDKWDAIWYAKTSQNEDSWIAEYFIPWGVAPMAEVEGKEREIKVSVARKYVSENLFFNMPGLWIFQSPFLSKLHPIYIDNYNTNAAVGSKIDFFPYLSGTNNFIENNRSFNAGGEIFWDLDSETKIDISVNPDFGQVESDDLIVNFSANETFYRDKRPFFTENQSLFDISGWDTYFINTRRIGGIADKCSSTSESHKGECDDYAYKSSDINLALRYSKKGKKNQYGFFSAFEDDSIFSEGRDYIAARYKRNLSSINGKVGYLVTSVDRPSIDRKAQVHVIDYDFYLGNSKRFSGWLGNAETEEKGIKESGPGLRATLAQRFSDKLFSFSYLNYHHENFNINDMGYIKKRDNFSFGNFFEYQNPVLDKNSSVSQHEFGLRLGYQKSANEGYGNGFDLYFDYEAQFKDRSKIKFSCQCTLTRGKDYVETRKYASAPFIEQLSTFDLSSSYSTPDTKRYQSIYKFKYSSSGYQSNTSVADLRSESFSLGYSTKINPSELAQITLDWFNYERRNNWSKYSAENLFGYYDKRLVSSGASLDLFIGNRQEFKIKATIYGLTGENSRAYRVSSSGYMESSSDSLNDFQLSETALQMRYKYEFSPLSNLYVVYTRAGKLANILNSADSINDIYSDAWTNQTLDKFIVKIRYKF